MQVMVDGLLTSYEKSGKGKTVVLLHGWGDRAGGLRHIRQELSRHYTVIAPDLPGFGTTAAPQSPWDLYDYARFVAHFLKKIEEEDIYAFIGHSNGGAIALRGIGQDILRAERLVLLASAGIRSAYNGRKRTLRLIVKAAKVVVLPLPAPVKRTLRRKVYGMIGSDMLVAEHLQKTFKRIVTDDVQADARRVLIPVLLLYGEMDRATPVVYGEIFHELINTSTLEVLPEAGHFLHVDRSQETIKAIEEFLQ